MPMWQRWAHFRFSVIGRLLSCPPEKGQLQSAIAELAQKTYQHPIESSRLIHIGASTIERWYYKARSATDPIAVLGRKIRSDAGIRWSMSQILLEVLRAQHEAHPRWNVQLHYDNLVATAKEQRFEPVPSYKTVLRCIRDKKNLTKLLALKEEYGGKIVRAYKSTYKRHGTFNLFAALNIATGKVFGKVTKEKRRPDFILFMDEILAELPKEREVHVILDNYCTHKKNEEWLQKHPNVFFHFSPTSASWLNQIL